MANFDLPTYLVLLYNVPFLGLFWIPLPTLMRDVINGRSPYPFLVSIKSTVQAWFLEAPFVRMLRMRSASFKMAILKNFK